MFPLEKIYLDVRSENDWVSQYLLKELPDVPVERIEDKRSLIKEFLSRGDPIGTGKRNLFLTSFYGKRLKPCPGTSNHICCGYHVINAVTNCPMDCSYCILQAYLNNPFLTLYTNWDGLFDEIESFLSQDSRACLRLGTGELSDSLALDPIFPIAPALVSYFSVKRNGILELKTKTAEINHLLPLIHKGRTVISWSLNPQKIIEEEEKGTASLERRIDAARRCQESGYPVGFHFDPIFCYDGWEKGYEEVLLGLFKAIDSKGVAWVSLGGFRYPPQLKGVANERFPDTRIFLGELFPGRDGKFRYLKEIRVELYRSIAGLLREWDHDLFIYLCMESEAVWKEVFGWAPSGSRELNRLFEERVRRFAG